MSDDDWSDDDVVPIEDLTSATIEGVALRLRDSRSFGARVNREAELDALWTLADMVRNAELCGLIFRAHDLNGEARCDEAADMLAEAAQLVDGRC